LLVLALIAVRLDPKRSKTHAEEDADG